jgi:transmembrane sensor
MNPPNKNISEELLARYMAETASADEKKQVQSWRNESPSHEKEFLHYQLLWEKSSALKNKKLNVDTDIAWKKVRLKMDQPKKVALTSDEMDEINLSPTHVTRRFPAALWIAATVALLLTAFGWYFYKSRMSDPEMMEMATAAGTKELTLPDGTKVFLNYHSALSFPKNFEGDSRLVKLKGEAFFDVKPDAQHPFIIEAQGTEVKVLGTSFNVKAYAEKPVRVDVQTGKVAVKNGSSEKKLIKGESAEATKNRVETALPDANRLAYHTRVYDFNANDLNDVIATIREGYHVDVRLSDPRAGQCKLTIHFENEPIESTLPVIAESLNLKLRKEGSIYWLDGHECK